MADSFYPITVQSVVVFVVLVTVTECHTDTDCTAGYYLDTVTGKCDSCSDICTFTRVQRTKELCQLKCPGWSPYQSAPSQTVSATLSPSSTSTTPSNTTPFPKREIPTHAVILMCVGVAVAGFVAIVMCFNKRIHSLLQNIKLTRRCRKRGVQETPGLLGTHSEPTAPPMEGVLLA